MVLMQPTRCSLPCGSSYGIGSRIVSHLGFPSILFPSLKNVKVGPVKEQVIQGSAL